MTSFSETRATTILASIGDDRINGDGGSDLLYYFANENDLKRGDLELYQLNRSRRLSHLNAEHPSPV